MNRLNWFSVSLGRTALSLCVPKQQSRILSCRNYQRHTRIVHKELYERRIAAGPEPDRPRSAWRDWNYDSELYAFGKRLHEDFSDSLLRIAFVDETHVEQEQKKRKDLGIEDPEDGESSALSLKDNSELAIDGFSIASSYIIAYLRHTFPKLIETGVEDIHNYLMSEEMLAHISSHIGVKDLVLCSEFPPPSQTLAKTLMGVIGALAKSQDKQRAELFVQDFILTQLHGKELIHLVNIQNPMGLLADILQKEGRGEPEARLLWETGTETIMAAYVVGVYSDKQLIGQSPGETILLAEEMAARDALRKYFGLMDNMAPLKFGTEGHKLNVTGDK